MKLNLKELRKVAEAASKIECRPIVSQAPVPWMIFWGKFDDKTALALLDSLSETSAKLKALERVREAVKESDIFNRHIEPCRHEYRHCTCGRDEVMEALTTYDTLEKSEC